MPSKMLTANRGEIAVHSNKTCLRMGIATAVVDSRPDGTAKGVNAAAGDSGAADEALVEFS